MQKINVLDCTLRDGGCVNNFNFGYEYMNKIISGLEEAFVDAIECGYLDSNNGTEDGRTQFNSEEAIEKSLLVNGKKEGISYLAMMDYGKYDANKLPLCSEKTVDGIRLAFHKEAIEGALEEGKIVLEKGYQLFIQPMIAKRYSDSEMISLINRVNELEEVAAFYLVDSFGEMRLNEVKHLMYLIDYNLNRGIAMGFHSHNNLQLSYSNAVAILEMNLNRNLYIDSSIMGMGKGAGNLNTELIIDYLNLEYQKEYKIAPLLTVIDEVINPLLYMGNKWGYSIEFYLSSIAHCSPTYANYYYNKHTLKVSQIFELLTKLDKQKKISFDKIYAEEKYVEYNSRAGKISGELFLEEKICGKKVMLIAPGKSILQYRQKIIDVISHNDVFVISLNADVGFDTNVCLITKNIPNLEVICMNQKVIITSNVDAKYEKIESIDYKKWTKTEDGYKDISAVVALNLVKAFKAKKVYLAGFDGFSKEITENYFDRSLCRPLPENLVEERNRFIGKYIKDIGQYLQVEFLTPSKYLSFYNEKIGCEQFP